MFYQTSNSWELVDNYEIQIMKLDTMNDKNITIVKTYWIRLIQRHWKKIMNKHKEIMDKRNCFKNRLRREIQRGYPLELRWLPCIRGMLSIYKK
jgi:hypothetical protein